MTTIYAPIAIFCYRRPQHLRLTLQSLLRCDGFDKSPVFLFCDGPRGEQDRESVHETQAVARELLGSRAIYHFSQVNCGLSSSITAGVDKVLESYDRVIVIEDDLELSSSFLRFMNAALDRYADEENIYQISGYMFGDKLSERREAFLLPLTTSWGWATWRRAWQAFDPAAQGWEKVNIDTDLRRRFNFGGYDYAKMLERQMLGKADSWAIRWYWSVFRRDGMVVFPPTSLVRNNGFDGSGTHGRGVLGRFRSGPDHSDAPAPLLPERLKLDSALVAQAAAALRWQNGGWKSRIGNAIRSVLGR